MKKQEMEPIPDKAIINRLINKKKLCINDKDAAFEFFNKYSYTDLVIYKDVFYDHVKHIYKENISLEHIVALHNFDVDVKLLMLKYILLFEKKLKKLFITMIQEQFADVEYQMLNRKKLLIKDNNEFKKFENEIHNLMYRYGKFYSHYSDDINCIPCWALLEKFTLGMLQTYYLFLPKDCRKKISLSYKIHDSDFSLYLSTISLVRNKSAHGDILVISKFPYLKSKNNRIYDDLEINFIVDKSGNRIRKYGINDFYSVLIIFKKILNEKEFNDFYLEFNKLYECLNSSCNDDEVLKIILEKIHMPENWRKIKDV